MFPPGNEQTMDRKECCMNILHITPHLGGGVGTVIMDWLQKVEGHQVRCLDVVNDKAWKSGLIFIHGNSDYVTQYAIMEADIVLVHYWDHSMLAELLSQPLPACRLAFWVHKHFPISEKEVAYPDRCIGTSLIQFLPDYIWSTGDIGRFLSIQPKPHVGFNVGYIGTVDYKKIHPHILDMCKEIKKVIKEAHFIFIGEDKISGLGSGVSVIDPDFTFTGKVDDVTPYLAEMDVFGYPLRPDHYGTCEQVLGEAMSAGIIPVVMNNPAEKLIVRDRWSGMIAKDEDDYVRGIASLYFILSRHKRYLSTNAKYEAKRLYSLDTMIQQWDEVFESMMQQPKKARGAL
jgi:glycosyltransferase involved in cell wall biosynthesis